MEEAILLFIQNYIRQDFLDPIMIFITHLGDSAFIWIALAIIFLLFKKTRPIAYMMLISLALSYLFNSLFIKSFIHRIRPYEIISELECLIKAPSTYSFPSGHAAFSFAAGIVVYKMADRRVGGGALVLANLIAFSRLYVGVHYPSDVLFGILSGSLIALLSVYFYQKYCQKQIQKQ